MLASSVWLRIALPTKGHVLTHRSLIRGIDRNKCSKDLKILVPLLNALQKMTLDVDVLSNQVDRMICSVYSHSVSPAIPIHVQFAHKKVIKMETMEVIQGFPGNGCYLVPDLSTGETKTEPLTCHHSPGFPDNNLVAG